MTINKADINHENIAPLKPTPMVRLLNPAPIPITTISPNIFTIMLFSGLPSTIMDNVFDSGVFM